MRRTASLSRYVSLDNPSAQIDEIAFSIAGPIKRRFFVVLCAFWKLPLNVQCIRTLQKI